MKTLIEGRELVSLAPPVEATPGGPKVGSSRENVLLPPVTSGASVKWSGNRLPEPPRVTIVARLDATMDESEAAEGDDAGVPKRQRTDKSYDNYSIGTLIFVPAKSWADYTKKWPYPYPIDNSYIKGVVNELNVADKYIGISFPVFDLLIHPNKAYLKKWCRIIGALPIPGHEITKDLYDKYENAPREGLWTPITGDKVYVCATAWKLTSYKDVWRYQTDMADTFFEATVTVRGTKFKFHYDAFQLTEDVS
jgi:hypothetical protein